MMPGVATLPDGVISLKTDQVPSNPHNHRFVLAAYALRN